MSRWCWRVAGHLQTHEEPREAAQTHRAHTGPDPPALLTLWPELLGPPNPNDRANPRAAMQPQPLHLCRTKLGDTVGGGVELQAERASTALQGTLLPAQAAVGAARLQAPAAAPGCVVGAGETIKLQSQRIE